MDGRVIAKFLIRLVVTVLAAGLFGSLVVVLAPAFGVTEAELDTRLDASTIEAIRGSATASKPDFARNYFRYVAGFARGDFGFSSSLNRPVSELLGERLPVSVRNLSAGAALGAGVGLLCAVAVFRFRSPLVRIVPSAASTGLLSIPSAALALLFLIAGWPGPLALAALVFPRVYRYSYAALARWADSPHVVAAEARGLPPWRILFAHTLAPAAPQLFAVLGMAVSVAFPALVPIEAVCDSPGIGQLAWKAALARDLPVLVVLTMVAAVIVSVGNAAADLTADAARRHA